MTCCTAFVYGPSPWRASSAMSEPRVGRWHPSLDLLPLEAAAGPLWPRDPAAAGTAPTAHGQPDQCAGRAARGRLRVGPPWLRPGPHRGRAGPASLGRHRAVDQWGMAGAGSPRPVHPGPALCLVAGSAAPAAPERPTPAPERHLQVDHPGELVQLDCFCVGRLSGTKGTVWQDTAIDVASAYTWATLQVTRRNPSATWTSALAAPSPPISPATAGSSSG